MKRYRIFNSAAEFITALCLTVGLTIGLGGAVHAQDVTSGTNASAPHGKSAGEKNICPVADPA